MVKRNKYREEGSIREMDGEREKQRDKKIEGKREKGTVKA